MSWGNLNPTPWNQSWKIRQTRPGLQAEMAGTPFFWWLWIHSDGSKHMMGYQICPIYHIYIYLYIPLLSSHMGNSPFFQRTWNVEEPIRVPHVSTSSCRVSGAPWPTKPETSISPSRRPPPLEPEIAQLVTWLAGKSSTMWGPLVISWFITPSNYGYNYHKP